MWRIQVAQRSGVLHSDCPPSRTREITFAEFPSRPRYVEALGEGLNRAVCWWM